MKRVLTLLAAASASVAASSVLEYLKCQVCEVSVYLLLC